MEQQTAVDWFSIEIFNQFELLKSGIINDEEFRNGLLNKRDQSKKIENLQIMNSHIQGFSEGVAFATTPINKDTTTKNMENKTFEQLWEDFKIKNPNTVGTFQDQYKSFKWLYEQLKVTEDTSDGYHTFKELYEFRMVYNAILFNEWGLNNKYEVHKSLRHYDGELCFNGGWFIVVAILPTGQISNHYEEKYWNLFNIPQVEKASYPFDGHTSQDVIERLKNI